MLLGIPMGAIYVQRFDDSLNSAIRIAYHISLRSSSIPGPNHGGFLKVLYMTQEPTPGYILGRDSTDVSSRISTSVSTICGV